MNTMSWSTPTTPLPMEINPRVVFERLFGRAGSAAQRATRMKRNRSMLDSIKEDARDLQRGLGARDRARLDGYLGNIREIERRIQQTEAKNRHQVTSLDAPLGVPESYGEHAALMFDLMAVAYQADLTRVVTFMMAREVSIKTYPELGITIPHHPLSHHGNQPKLVATHAKLNTYHMQLFAKFLEKLRATPDGDGSLLDHSLILYGSGMGNGNAHSAWPLPVMAAGGLMGKGHRHIQTAEKTPLGNMWVTVAEKFDIEVESFGGSNGKVELSSCDVAPLLVAKRNVTCVSDRSTRNVAGHPRSARDGRRGGRETGAVDAVKQGNKATVRALLKQRADVKSAEADGTTALHWAVQADDLEMTQLLVRAGANVNAANRYGVTPLSLAATNGNAAIIEALLKAGAERKHRAAGARRC